MGVDWVAGLALALTLTQASSGLDFRLHGNNLGDESK